MAKIQLPPLMTSRQRKSGEYWLWQPPSRMNKQGFKAIVLAPSLPVATAQATWINLIYKAVTERRADAARMLFEAWASGRNGAGLGLSPRATACPMPPGFVMPGIGAATQMPEAEGARTLNTLTALYKQSMAFRNLRRSTARGYELILNDMTRFLGKLPIETLRRKKLRALYESHVRTRSLASANARMRVMSILLSHAVEIEWIEVNPMTRFRMAPTPGRIRVATEDEIAQLIAAAKDMMRLDGVLLITVAMLTGQRRGDMVERMTLNHFNLTRFRFEQSKTEKVINIGMLDEVTTAATEALAVFENRWGNLDAHFAALKLRNPRGWYRHLKDTPLLWNLDTGLPLDRFSATRLFGLVRDHAGIVDLTLSDFRDYLVTELFRAGCTDAEVSSISGHSVKSIALKRRHYVDQFDPVIADNAFAKLRARRAKMKG